MAQEEKLEKEYKQALIKILASTNEDTHLNKMKMIDLVKKYVYLLLGKEYKLNKINMPRVEFFDDDEVEGYFDHNSLTIQINEASFLNRETLIEDIDTIFHEMRHFAQYVADRKDNDKLSRNITILPRGSALVNALTYTNFNSEDFGKLAKGDVKMQNKYFVTFDKYFHSLNKLYYLRDVEMDARSFSANTLYDLLFDIDVSKFNQNELKNLDFFREKASQVFQDEEDVLFNTEATFAIPKHPLTGYIHGGCSPIGMKKFFTTTVHYTAEALPTFCFSGGKIGWQVEMSLDDLKKLIRLQCADIIE